MRAWWLAVVAAAVLSLPLPARAEWREARTAHFTLTIDDSEEGARDLAARLERFDAALRKLYNVVDSPDRPPRPIAIYALKDPLYTVTCRCLGTLGFYRARAAGSVIFLLHVPELDKRNKVGAWSSQTLLLHEYGHHFAFSNFPIAYPPWFTEGFAEFNAPASFEPDGSVVIGNPANYRGKALLGGQRMPIKRLFDPYRMGFGSNIDLFYGRGWLLTHYLILAPNRPSQLAAYLSALNKDESSLTAAEHAFGDLDALDDELDRYQRAPLAPPVRIPPQPTAGAVTVAALPAGQAELLPTRLLAMVGLARNYRLGPAQSAEKIAARYSEDAVLQAQAAEMSFYAGRLDQADAAADAALRVAPDMIDALVRKGMVAVRRAVEAKSQDPAVWQAARGWYLRANRIDADAVMPLYLYYASFVAAKAPPPAGAVNALKRAMVLAPESNEIGVALARQMLIDGDGATARAILAPLAFVPHRRAAKNLPLRAVELIDAGKLAEARAALEGDTEED